MKDEQCVPRPRRMCYEQHSDAGERFDRPIAMIAVDQE
jgi:hypothetical protein